MSESDAMIGYDTAYAIHDGADPGDFIDVAEVTEIDPPDQQADDVKVTHFKSPDKTHDYIPGMIEPGDMSFGINYIPGGTTEATILDLKTSGVARKQRITWPNGATWIFSGYIKGFKPTVPLDDRLTATVSIKVTSSTAVTAASSS